VKQICAETPKQRRYRSERREGTNEKRNTDRYVEKGARASGKPIACIQRRA